MYLGSLKHWDYKILQVINSSTDLLRSVQRHQIDVSLQGNIVNSCISRVSQISKYGTKSVKVFLMTFA